MNRIWIVGLAVLAMAEPLVGSGIAQADTPVAPRTLVVGASPTIPSGAVRASASLPGSLSASVVLKPVDAGGLQAYATAASTPGDPDYRHFLTPAEVQRKFGPSPSTVDDVRNWLASEGLDVHPTEGDGVVVPFTGSPGELEARSGRPLRATGWQLAGSPTPMSLRPACRWIWHPRSRRWWDWTIWRYPDPT